MVINYIHEYYVAKVLIRKGTFVIFTHFLAFSSESVSQAMNQLKVMGDGVNVVKCYLLLTSIPWLFTSYPISHQTR